VVTFINRPGFPDQMAPTQLILPFIAPSEVYKPGPELDIQYQYPLLQFGIGLTYALGPSIGDIVPSKLPTFFKNFKSFDTFRPINTFATATHGKHYAYAKFGIKYSVSRPHCEFRSYLLGVDDEKINHELYIIEVPGELRASISRGLFDGRKETTFQYEDIRGDRFFAELDLPQPNHDIEPARWKRFDAKSFGTELAPLRKPLEALVKRAMR